MIFIIVTLLTGTCLLLGFAGWLLYRRAIHVARAISSTEAKRTGIAKAAGELDQALIADLLAGCPLEQKIPQYLSSFRGLLPQNEPDRVWTPDDLKDATERWRSSGIESVNRRLLLPATIGSVLIVGGTAILSLIFYSFDASIPNAKTSSPALTSGDSSLGTHPHQPSTWGATTLPPLEPLPELTPTLPSDNSSISSPTPLPEAN